MIGILRGEAQRAFEGSIVEVNMVAHVRIVFCFLFKKNEAMRGKIACDHVIKDCIIACMHKEAELRLCGHSLGRHLLTFEGLTLQI